MHAQIKSRGMSLEKKLKHAGLVGLGGLGRWRRRRPRRNRRNRRFKLAAPQAGEDARTVQVGRANWRELCNRGVEARHRPNRPVNCVRPAWRRCQGGRGLLIYRLWLQRSQREVVSSPRGSCRVILGPVLPKQLKDARAIGIAVEEFTNRS